MQLIISILIFLAINQAMALSCQVILFTNDESFDRTFKVPLNSKGHGGFQKEFKSKSGNNRIVAMADGKWLGISWFQGQDIIAESISLIKNETTQPCVLISYNPTNTDELVSVDCGEENQKILSR